MVIFRRFSAEIKYFCNYEPLNVAFLVLISYLTPKASLIETFKANFGPSKFRSHGPGSSERGKNGHFSAILLKIIFVIKSP